MTQTQVLNYVTTLGLFLVSPVGIVLGGAILIAVLYVAVRLKREKEITWVETILQSVQTMLGSKLGNKSSAILDCWLDAIQAASDGNFTLEEREDIFMEFVAIALGKQNVTLNEDEKHTVKDAAVLTLSLLPANKPVQAAVTTLSLRRPQIVN